VNIGICLGNSHGNFQLHRFTTSENIAKSFFGGGLLFLTHTVVIINFTISATVFGTLYT